MTSSYALQRRQERAADKAELEQIRAGRDRCTCGHKRSEHVDAGPGQVSCQRPLCGHLFFEQDQRYAR